MKVNYKGNMIECTVNEYKELTGEPGSIDVSVFKRKYVKRSSRNHKRWTTDELNQAWLMITKGMKSKKIAKIIE